MQEKSLEEDDPVPPDKAPAKINPGRHSFSQAALAAKAVAEVCAVSSLHFPNPPFARVEKIEKRRDHRFTMRL